MKKHYAKLALLALLVIATWSLVAHLTIAKFGYLVFPDPTFEITTSDDGCDQSGTTTPCAELLALPTEEPVIETKTPQVTTPPYGPLELTYSDTANGFTFNYPKELQIERGGDIILNDKTNSRRFAIKICIPGTPCASGTTRTITEITQPQTSRPEPSRNSKYNQVFYRVTPIEVATSTTASGITLLKVRETHRYYNERNEDITDSVCEMCGGSTVFYYVYREPTNYVKFWHITGDTAITEKILNTISME